MVTYLLVAVLDVGAARQQQLDEVLVAARAGQRERRVVVGVGLAVHVHGGVGGGRGLRRGRVRRVRAVRVRTERVLAPREPTLRELRYRHDTTTTTTSFLNHMALNVE